MGGPSVTPSTRQDGLIGRRSLTLCLAVRFEAFVESDGALRIMPIERQSEEELLWHSLIHKSRNVLEPEFPVIIRMSH